MRFRTFTLPALAVAITFALPGLAQADSMHHRTAGETGFTYHPEHFQSTKSRAEVIAELEAARKNGTLASMLLGLPLPIKSPNPGKTRQQVIDEMLNEPPQQRLTRMELYSGG